MPSQTKENYLKSIYALADSNGNVSLSDLSREIGVSNPTANNMVKKLQEQGWVRYEKYRPLQLTEQGELVASLIIRKHRIAEMYLVEKMGFGWEEVHDIAEEMEHIDSDLLFERMDRMLDYPSVDPHGSPIPGKDGTITPVRYSKLADIEPGARVRFCALTRSPTDLLLYLNSKEISLGTEMQVIGREAFDHSTTVAYGSFDSVMLSSEVCNLLLVEIL